MNAIKKICTDKRPVRKEKEKISLGYFLACRLIRLEKNQGIRPVEVDEILRKICDYKDCESSYKKKTVGSLQLCWGKEGSSELAIHTNVKYLCPVILTCLSNRYVISAKFIHLS